MTHGKATYPSEQLPDEGCGVLGIQVEVVSNVPTGKCTQNQKHVRNRGIYAVLGIKTTVCVTGIYRNELHMHCY